MQLVLCVCKIVIQITQVLESSNSSSEVLCQDHTVSYSRRVRVQKPDSTRRKTVFKPCSRSPEAAQSFFPDGRGATDHKQSGESP